MIALAKLFRFRFTRACFGAVAAVMLIAPSAASEKILRLAADQPKADKGGCICMELYQPVCAASRNGKKQTYSNACFAKCAKAAVIHQGAC